MVRGAPTYAAVGVIRYEGGKAISGNGNTRRNEMSRCAHRRARGERAQATVEFALVLPILVLILFGVFAFGRAFWTYQQLSAATSEGARRAAVSRTNSDKTTAVTNAVKNAAPSLNANKITVSISPDGSSTWTSGSSVSVTAKYPEQIKILGITFFDGNLTTTRTTRVEA